MKNFAFSKNPKRKSSVSAIIKFLKEMFVDRNSQLTIGYINAKTKQPYPKQIAKGLRRD